MAVTGRKPKDGPKRNRMAPTHDWIEVEDTPFDGPSPDLPVLIDPETGLDRFTAQTRRWYEVVRHLPHAVLWDEGEWQEIATTALIHSDVWNGQTVRAAELRMREKALGLTADARRDLRIRYLTTRTSADEDTSEQPVVVSIRRDRKPRADALDS